MVWQAWRGWVRFGLAGMEEVSMTYKKKVDANQANLVALFRELGASVVDTSAVGKGMTDAVVQFMPRNRAAFGKETHLVEFKNGSLPPSKQKLTPDQVKFHAIFKCTIINCEDDVYKLMGVRQ